MCEGEERCIQSSSGKIRKHYLEDLGAEGKMIAIPIDKKCDGGGGEGFGIASIDLAEEIDRQRALVNAVVNLRLI